MLPVGENAPRPAHNASPVKPARPRVAAESASAPGATEAGQKPDGDQVKVKQEGQRATFDLNSFAGADKRRFDQLDKNDDGALTGNEIKGEWRDRNGDGKVTKTEFQFSQAHVHANRMLEKLDKNGDGVLTGNEIKKGLQGADANGDGKITLREMKQEIREKAGLTDEDLFGAFDGNGDKVLSGNELKAEQLKRWDADGDGKVTEEEFLKARESGRANRDFKDADGNADGFLSGNEIGADLLAQLDLDQDGRVSKDEFLAPRPEAPTKEDVVVKVRADDPLPGPDGRPIL